MNNEKEKSSLIYACSGCADVGEVADKVVRQISKSGKLKMFCLVGIGAGIESFITKAKEANRNITVDGCHIGCAKKVIENIGLQPESYVLTDMGLVKGQTVITDDLIAQTVAKIT